MDKRTYNQTRQNLTEQLAKAQAILADFSTFDAFHGKPGGVADGVSDAAFAAHALVFSIKAQISDLDAEWDWAGTPEATRQLVSANED